MARASHGNAVPMEYGFQGRLPLQGNSSDGHALSGSRMSFQSCSANTFFFPFRIKIFYLIIILAFCMYFDSLYCSLTAPHIFSHSAHDSRLSPPSLSHEHSVGAGAESSHLDPQAEGRERGERGRER